MCRQNSTILCIDDDWNSLESLETLLELNGYDVLIATSGRQGLELLASHRVDGVILDYRMPEMHGDLFA
jgi:CheY-like chemotaxis protein